MLVRLVIGQHLAKLLSGAGVVQGELVGAAHGACGFAGQRNIRTVQAHVNHRMRSATYAHHVLRCYRYCFKRDV